MTESVCPICLERIGAERVTRGDQVQLVKTCPAHGEFKTVIWKGRPAMREWRRPKTPLLLRPAMSEARFGCPFDCGLCREHRQRSCTILLEVTRRCNLRCPVCFAGAQPGSLTDPTLAEVRGWFQMAVSMAPGSNIQLSGGEPTLREDLPEIVDAGRTAGVGFIQLNTNGIRLGGDPEYVKALRQAGLASVFLQFDGPDDAAHLKLRGRALTAVKRSAIEACAAHGIGVVLVPTLVPGVNTHQIGSLLQFALERSPTVRGVHFQPVSYFGRYPQPNKDAPRITLPELMAAIESQSGGMLKAADFRPPGCENAWCSMHADYLVLPNAAVRPLRPCGPMACGSPPIPAEEGAHRSISHVSRQWAGPSRTVLDNRAPRVGDADSNGGSSSGRPMRLDDFIDRVRTHAFTVSAMVFQDAWTLDLERLRDCCIHVLDPQRGLVPFCAFNLTAINGKALYRR